MDGSWTFTRDGDCLTATFADGDFAGMGMTLDVIEAVGAYLGMNTSLINSYVNGLSALGIESGNFSIADDEGAGWSVRLNADEAAVGKIIDDIAEGFSYAIVHFGA